MKKMQSQGLTNFNVFVVIAIAEDLEVDCDPLILDFSKSIHAKRTVYRTRHWRNETMFNSEGWSFHNWIEETFSNGIYKGQSLHSTEFETVVFEPFWKTLYKQPS
jgi:hypothetical protein